MVKKNEYPRKDFSKDSVQPREHEHAPQNISQKSGDNPHKENNNTRNRPPRENQKAYQHRETQKRENTQRDNSQKENVPRENHQKNYHRENVQVRENTRETRENREQYRPHYQRTVIKPQAEETVEDIATDITRIEKEIELELKEIRSMKLGM